VSFRDLSDHQLSILDSDRDFFVEDHTQANSTNYSSKDSLMLGVTVRRQEPYAALEAGNWDDFLYYNISMTILPCLLSIN